MREALIEFVNSIKANRERIQAFDEATTKQAIILRIFHLLEWDVFDELVPEYPVLDGRVDFAIQRNGINYIFVEIKRVGAELQDQQEQILRYAFSEGVKLGVLTNGVSWWLYLPLAEGSWEQRRFFAIDLLEQDSDLVAENFVRFMARDRVVSNDAIRSAEEYRRSRQRQAILEKSVPIAWNKLVKEPDESLLDLLIDTAEAISGYRANQDIVARFINQYRNQFLVPEPLDRTGLPSSEPPRKKLRKVETPLADYTGSKPRSFKLGGATYEVDSWIGMLFRVCDLLYQQDPDYFINVCLSLRGRKRPYFSLNPDELRTPDRFRQTDVYIETNLSSSSIVGRCRSLLAAFNYDLDEFQIQLE